MRRRARRRRRHDRIDRKIFRHHIRDWPQFHAVLPVKIQMHARHHRARQVRRPARVLHLRRTCRVVMIEHNELERDRVREVRHIFRPAPERCAHVGIDALQIIEKCRRRDVPRNSEARPIRNRAIGLQKQSALVIEDVFLVIRFGSAARRNCNADTRSCSPATIRAAMAIEFACIRRRTAPCPTFRVYRRITTLGPKI